MGYATREKYGLWIVMNHLRFLGSKTSQKLCNLTKQKGLSRIGITYGYRKKNECSTNNYWQKTSIRIILVGLLCKWIGSWHVPCDQGDTPNTPVTRGANDVCVADEHWLNILVPKSWTNPMAFHPFWCIPKSLHFLVPKNPKASSVFFRWCFFFFTTRALCDIATSPKRNVRTARDGSRSRVF